MVYLLVNLRQVNKKFLLNSIEYTEEETEEDKIQQNLKTAKDYIKTEIKDKILEIRNKTIDRLLDFGITLENKLLKQDKILPNNEILEDISIVKKDITRILDDFKTGEEDKVYAIRSKKLYKDFWEKYKEIENRME